jgi:hypothetical protein
VGQEEFSSVPMTCSSSRMEREGVVNVKMIW